MNFSDTLFKFPFFFLDFLERSKWVMLKKARRSLLRNVLSATLLKKLETTKQNQIFGVYLATEQDKLQDFLT